VGPTFAIGCVLFPAPLMLVPAAGGARPLVPAGLRSRVAGSYMVVNYGVRPIGSLIGGLMGASLGLPPAVWVATVGAVAGVLWLLPSPIMRLRELPEPAD